MDRNYLLKDGKREKEAAETSLERIRRSIEGALEKEKETVQKEAVNRYIRDASLRMSLNLPIKPTKSHLKEDQNHEQKNTLKGSDYKLPSLQHGDGSPIRRPVPELHMLNTENPARPNTSNTNMSIDTFSPSPNKPNIRLPPIIIDTGQQEKGGKRKRKKDESNEVNKQKKKSPERFTGKPAKTRLESVSPTEEDFNVVMCGRSPRVINETKELFVSKHGRFKSK
ncbi:uncharacterized protein LOC116299462 [Actinia tenebrosa]|uniref:Uncharacterized protein LOC116299462 n=1 Tax=Actinia tenebrosa TaxID=6105 RepID=A0A6P8IE33_ACTTE|nr:uncharacterized protein LOC116299462 [Actinia tenebrosa]